MPQIAPGKPGNPREHNTHSHSTVLPTLKQSLYSTLAFDCTGSYRVAIWGSHSLCPHDTSRTNNTTQLSSLIDTGRVRLLLWIMVWSPLGLLNLSSPVQSVYIVWMRRSKLGWWILRNTIPLRGRKGGQSQTLIKFLEHCPFRALPLCSVGYVMKEEHFEI